MKAIIFVTRQMAGTGSMMGWSLAVFGTTPGFDAKRVPQSSYEILMLREKSLV